MEEPCETSSSSPPPPKPMNGKPVVVRVKRKASQARFDAFWLEINERPLKKPLLDLESLSISDYSAKVLEESRTKRLLVQHVETISPTHAVKGVSKPFLPDFSGSKDFKRKIEERKRIIKQDSQKQDQLRSSAKQKHEDLVRSARFEQIWKRRRGSKGADDDSLHEICHLYDVVQVDNEDENSAKMQEPEHVHVEDNAILCNYLPLLREFIPSAAEVIESDMMDYISNKDNYVYDLYAVEDGSNLDEEGTSTEYPLVQVNDDDDDYCDGSMPSDYETDDSNAEDNPRNDYPDEESSGHEEIDLLDDSQDSDSQYEDEVVDVEEDDENWRWGHR